MLWDTERANSERANMKALIIEAVLEAFHTVATPEPQTDAE
jgi:hypothetical protein|tara:strand:+ start:1906 stop:2028 length:123 start_codon:yes stop_codon:yes gene_type:complete